MSIFFSHWFLVCLLPQANLSSEPLMMIYTVYQLFRESFIIGFGEPLKKIQIPQSLLLIAVTVSYFNRHNDQLKLKCHVWGYNNSSMSIKHAEKLYNLKGKLFRRQNFNMFICHSYSQRVYYLIMVKKKTQKPDQTEIFHLQWLDKTICMLLQNHLCR